MVAGFVSLGVFGLIVVLSGLTPERWVDLNQAKADSWTWRLSVASADTSLILLALTMLIGPLRVWRGGQPVVHQPGRRLFGLWSATFGLFHVGFAVFVHTKGLALWENWLDPSSSKSLPLLTGKRGLANWFGLAQVLLIVGLMLISRNSAIRRLGARRWKQWQRFSYLLAILVTLHLLLYQSIEQRIDRHRLGPLLVVLLLLVGQVGAVVLQRRRLAAVNPGSSMAEPRH